MRKMDGKTLMELILLVIAVIFWGLRKFGVLTAPWALMVAALSLAVSMGLLGMGYIAQKQKSRKIAGVLLLAFQNPIMQLFTHDAEVVAFGCTAMHYFCPFYWELSILHGLAGTVRGTGKTVPPMVVLLVSLCVFRIGWIQWVLPFFRSIDGIFILYPVSWGLGAVLMILYTWKANWLET